jgi:hypothetical protein
MKLSLTISMGRLASRRRAAGRDRDDRHIIFAAAPGCVSRIDSGGRV